MILIALRRVHHTADRASSEVHDAVIGLQAWRRSIDLGSNCVSAGALDQQVVAHSEVFQAVSIRGAHADRITKKR